MILAILAKISETLFVFVFFRTSPCHLAHFLSTLCPLSFLFSSWRVSTFIIKLSTLYFCVFVLIIEHFLNCPAQNVIVD